MAEPPTARRQTDPAPQEAPKEWRDEMLYPASVGFVACWPEEAGRGLT